MRGILPACQCLKSADLARHRTDLRLVVDLDIALAHRLLERADDVAAEIDFLLHRRVELRPRQIVRILDAVARNLRAIHDERNIRQSIRRLIDPCLDLHRQPKIVDAHTLMDELDAVPGLLRVRRHCEMIVVKARDKPALERLAQEIGHIAQETVPMLEPVTLIKALEIFNIKVHERQRLGQHILQMGGCGAHELHHVEQSRNLTKIALAVLFEQNIPPPITPLVSLDQNEIRAYSSIISRRLIPPDPGPFGAPRISFVIAS